MAGSALQKYECQGSTKEGKSVFEEAIERLNQEISNMPIAAKFDYKKRAYTVEDIQNILGLSRASAYRLMKSNQFHVVRIGSQIRVPVKAFEEWLEGK